MPFCLGKPISCKACPGTKTKKAPVHWSAAKERKGASRPAGTPRINCGYTGCQPMTLFPLSVYGGFRLFVLLGGTFKRCVFDALEDTRVPCLLGEQFCWHPVLLHPTPPPHRAPRPDPPVVSPGFPGHALHEKCSHTQRGFGPLVSSQDERALLVPRINRG